jgi:hypothetical protein
LPQEFTATSCAWTKLEAKVTHIHERRLLSCPYVSARDYLRDAMLASSNGQKTHSLPRTAPIASSGGTEKRVLVRYEPGRDPLQFDEPWNVYWTPEGGGPYPDFAGELTVRADENFRGAVLELTGDYFPPRDAAGQTLDMVAAAKLASAAAKGLLEQIARYLEDR